MRKPCRQSRRFSARRGFVVVTTMVSMVVLLGFCGLTIDIGYLFLVKTKMQTAADAAALAGVQELKMNGSSAVDSGAKHDAALNGFTDGVDGVHVTPHRPPQTGYYTSDQTAVEVIITKQTPTFFLQMLSLSSMKVSARSVARQTATTTCIYILNSATNKALTISGSADLESKCGIFVNSSDSQALNLSGSSKIVTTPANTTIVGNYNKSGSATITPAPVTGATSPSPADPLASRTLPTGGSCLYNNFSISGSSTVTINPGVYCGGLKISGSGTVNFNPGVYTMNGGGLDISGSVNTSGTGVTIFLTWDASHTYKGISISGSGTCKFTAPTSGPYESLLFVGDRSKSSSTGSSISGSASLQIDGVIYLPKEDLSVSGSSSATKYQIVVVDTLKSSGSTTYINNDYTSLSSGPPIKGSGRVSE